MEAQQISKRKISIIYKPIHNNVEIINNLKNSRDIIIPFDLRICYNIRTTQYHFIHNYNLSPDISLNLPKYTDLCTEFNIPSLNKFAILNCHFVESISVQSIQMTNNLPIRTKIEQHWIFWTSVFN